MKDGKKCKAMKKKVMAHLKEDTHEFKEQIRDDKKLKTAIKPKKKGK